jgi:hypothetical protein
VSRRINEKDEKKCVMRRKGGCVLCCHVSQVWYRCLSS